jgi:hypothetical protein
VPTSHCQPKIPHNMDHGLRQRNWLTRAGTPWHYHWHQHLGVHQQS